MGDKLKQSATNPNKPSGDIIKQPETKATTLMTARAIADFKTSFEQERQPSFAEKLKALSALLDRDSDHNMSVNYQGKQYDIELRYGLISDQDISTVRPKEGAHRVLIISEHEGSETMQDGNSHTKKDGGEEMDGTLDFWSNDALTASRKEVPHSGVSRGYILEKNAMVQAQQGKYEAIVEEAYNQCVKPYEKK